MLTDTPADSFNRPGPPQAPPSLRETLSRFHRSSIADRIAITRPKPMSTDKLDENLGVKLSTATLRQLRGVAESAGTTPSEMVRFLIEKHLEAERERFKTLHSIFGDPQA